MKHWIEAFRLRTLPLALSCIGMGGALAFLEGDFDGLIFGLACLTTVFLQILSNLANDYGDTQNGADSVEREGPSRAVQTGAITAAAMKKAIILFIVLSLFSGLTLLYISFSSMMIYALLFLLIGVLCIVAAIKYTAGSNPYGYAGLGDVSVFVFFGLVGVLGTVFLFTQTINVFHILPAVSLGAFSTGVLNVNNIRDIKSDELAGKRSIPVRLGMKKAKVYHWAILLVGMVSILIFSLIQGVSWQMLLFVLAYPLFIKNGIGVQKETESKKIDPYLKQLALSTLLFVVLFTTGVIIIS